jgi:hypothetical protein
MTKAATITAIRTTTTPAIMPPNAAVLSPVLLLLLLSLVEMAGIFDIVVATTFGTAPGCPSVAVAWVGEIVVVTNTSDVTVWPFESVVTMGALTTSVDGFVE